MSSSIYRNLYAVILGTLLAFIAASPATAAELPAYELDPTLSLRGDCKVDSVDPVPDPSCVGAPLAYPAPPNGPSAPFKEPRAVAVDSFGTEYVASWVDSNDTEGRIDVFDDEGFFVTEVAAPSVKSIAVDSKGNLYVFEDTGNIVRYPPSEYEPEAGDIAYENPAVAVTTTGFVGALAVDASNDQLFVSASGTITRYGSAVEGNGELESFSLAAGADWTEAIAIDAQRKRIYVTFCPAGKTTGCGVQVLERDAPHTLLKEILEVPTTPTPSKFAADFARMGLAVDEKTGDFFIGDIPAAKTVYRFNKDYEYLSRLKSSVFQANISIQIAVSNGKRSLAAEPCDYPGPDVPAGEACNRHYLFVPVLEKSNARALAFHPPDEIAPVIEEVSTGGIGETEAELVAEISPGGLDTEYAFQITTQADFEAEGFEGATTVGGGTISEDKLTTEVSVNATGLTPGETYRFRVVAENDLGKAVEEGQNEAVFLTYDDATSTSTCSNQVFRIGASARLPDCRAYELVTPADTQGRAPKGVGFVGNLFPTVESSPSGDALWFRIIGGSLSESSGVGGFEGDPYVARRGVSGWSSTLEGASGEEATVSIAGSTSPDQGYSFWSARIEGPLVIDGIETQYVRYPDGHSELIGRGRLGTDPRATGKLITEDARHIIFETIQLGSGMPIQLEEEAPPTGTRAVYDRTPDEVTHVVSLLPGDVTPAPGQNAAYVGASPDGEGIAFSIGTTLYLRVGNETSYEIGTGVKFAGVSEGGERIFYVEDGDLLAFDTSSEQVIEFSTAGEVTPVNVASEGARAYFVSEKVFGGANPQEELAQAGEQNLYLSEEGAISFVGTVTDRDVDGEAEGTTDGLGLWTEVLATQPAKDPSRLNPDGSVLLFQSRANLTGYDPGKSPQVFRYDSVTERLYCISCIPTGAPASGGASLETVTFDSTAPPPLSPSAFVHNLTPDGNRVFFESTEALVSADTDGVRDVYEWEENEVGSCDRAGGCVYLISSGQSAKENFLYAHSQSGNDVFFSTEDALTGADGPGVASIYDAKVGGGFAAAIEDKCIADGCRPGTSQAPGLPVPAKPSPGAEDNLPKPNKPKTCPKGKRKVKKNGKVRCVKKKQQKKAKKGKAGTSRGAGK
jgi:hypothetical protein